MPFINKLTGRFMCVLLMTAMVTGSLLALPVLAGQKTLSTAEVDSHRQSIEAWRADRHKRLARSNSWLSLVGLEWLKDGENRIGSAADNDIRLPGGPEHWGILLLQDDRLSFQNTGDGLVQINGETLPQADLVPDSRGRPTLVSSGSLSFYVIFRESYALRIKDSQAQALREFKGIENYPIDVSWRVEGRFVRASEGESIEIANVLGQVSDSPVFGAFEFEMDGKTHSLLGLGSEDSDSLWFIFADRTSGHGTYGAGRFLYSDSMPEDGRLIVDFNKAYNPPCVFSAYATCPLPPQRNRMDLLVTAGEKNFHAASGGAH